MKVLHVLQYSLPRLIGYAIRSDGLMRGSRANGINVVVLTGQLQATEDGEEEEINGIRYLRMKQAAEPKTPGFRQIKLLRALEHRLETAVRVERPDVIHVHSPAYNGLAGVRVGKRLGVPVVYEVRGTWEDAAVDQGRMKEGSIPYRLSRALETYVLRRADHTIGICQGLRTEFLRRGIPDKRITVVANGVDTEFLTPVPKDEALAAELGLGHGPVFGFFGTLFSYEGVEDLVDAVPAVLREAPFAKFLIVGGGEREKEVKEQVARVGRPDALVYRSRVPHQQMPSFYSLADVMVYPRRRNRLTDLVTPLKPLEAMAVGKAVAASDCGGHRELVIHEKTGLLYKAGVREALVETLVRLATHDELRKKLAEEGRRWVLAERKWDITTKPYVDVYQRLISKSGK